PGGVAPAAGGSSRSSSLSNGCASSSSGLSMNDTCRLASDATAVSSGSALDELASPRCLVGGGLACSNRLMLNDDSLSPALLMAPTLRVATARFNAGSRNDHGVRTPSHVSERS